ncbi:MAG: bifunctional oligoribonuclease/PAP phosphatase NrnA [Chloroflexota bacterium]
MTQATEVIDQVLDKAAELIQDAHRIAVMAHVNPDADAIGSVLGLSRGMNEIGKDVVPALSDPVPDYARFLPGSERIVSTLPAENFDLYIFADAAEIHRVGDIYLSEPSRFTSGTLLNIDHHRTNPGYGTVNYVDPHASSTSEMSYRLLHRLGAPIDANTATALLFGIVGDTGSFRNGATTPGSLEVAAHLLEHGAAGQQIAHQLFERKTFGAARLWGKIVSTIELDRERSIVFACLSQLMLAEEGVTVDETEGVAEYLRGVQEAVVVMLLKENDDGDVRVSMRSRPEVDVSAIATALGGGGHRQAAGCTVPGPFPKAKEVLLEAFDRLNRA